MLTGIQNRYPLAVISDVHGNSWALEAVLEDISRRGIKTLINLGDSLYGPLDPAGTASILMDLDMISVSGNEDRLITDLSARKPVSPTLKFVRENLSPGHIGWLKELNKVESLNRDILLFHGTPEHDHEYLVYDVLPNNFVLRSKIHLDLITHKRRETLFLFGHDHRPNVIKTAGGKLLVNPGSVGLPAYEDDVPYPHVVENGSPCASYCTVSRSQSGWKVQHFSIPYDYQSAGETAKKNNRPDWDYWLRTGRAG